MSAFAITVSVSGLLSEKSGAGNWGGKPPEHETAIKVRTERARAERDLFTAPPYFEDAFLLRATIHAIRSPKSAPDMSCM